MFTVTDPRDVVAELRKTCTCGHPVLLHEMNTRNVRTWCTYAGPAGRCPCTKCETT